MAEEAQPDPADSPAGTSTTIEVASRLLPSTLLVLPLHDRPFMPVQTMPLAVAEDPWLETFTEAGKAPQRALGLLMTRDGAPEEPAPREFLRVGTAVRLHQAARNDGQIQFVAEGLQRFRVVEWLSNSPPYAARVEYLYETIDVDDEMKAYAMALSSTLRELVPLNPLFSEELKSFVERFTAADPAALSWFAASLLNAEPGVLQEILETIPLRARLEQILELLRRELEVARLHADLRQQMDEKMSDQQRKHLLREQLKLIQQELGIAKDDRTAELDEWRERIDERVLTPEAESRIDEEMGKFAVLESGSPEYAVTRNYLDWLTGLPWGVSSDDRLDLDEARRVLNEHHTGLDDVKQRIIEFLAVGKLTGGISGSIILLVGPPGVGKTSIGQSLAKALGRRFFRFSVGGMRDEAEIKGHRRTYIGAMPGKFIQALKDTGTSNPVLMIDEVDKIGASYQGDPASALLEVLDPEQNQNFLDHYLDVRFDLSRVLFVCTANQLDSIPGPLLDRMETIRLSGYIAREKLAIARTHLWPRQLARAGIKPSRLRISDAALKDLIEGYAREAGVRGLDKQLARIVRKAAVRIVEGHADAISVTGRNLEEFLGKPLFRAESPPHGVGQITGLAWTSMGGATLTVEATRVHDGQRGLMLTGNLGTVMKESAQIAYSFVTAGVEALGGKAGWFDDAHVHLHVPEGATPKDGPSAGVTMATALASLALNRRVRPRLAMTGELTLSGRVLPVGGIREKVVAARRAGVRHIVLPADNRRDADELPDYLLDGIDVTFAEQFRQVFDAAFRRSGKSGP